MWTIIFLATTVICAIGWLTRYISTAALVYYIKKKGYAQPNENEIRECTLWVAKHLFNVK